MISITLKFVKKYNLCPTMSQEKWLQILLYMQEKGWVHYMMEDDNIVGMWGGWRVKKYNKKVLMALPVEEEGRVLYIPFACSEAKNRFIFLRELRMYLKDNDINRVVFNEFNKNGRLHKIKIRG